ncbi:MAG TPA: DNA-directed RNA polymerase subunit omega [Thermoanaerobaculia bacterium]|nr:DNA-directed RNA polymerase subunit omega [Thermoanaerobaculia bacterium]
MPTNVDSKFRYVLVAARRAEHLMRGARPKLENPPVKKPTRVAMGEIDGELVAWGVGPAPVVEAEVAADEAS